MAKLSVFPAETIISGFKGKLDYYVHNGIKCVRKWPKSPGHKRAPAVEAQWAAFTYAVHEWNNITPYVKETYQKMSHGSGLTSRDWFIRSYLTGLYPYPTAGDYP